MPAVATPAPQPGTVNYNALSPTMREVLAQVGLRLTAGFNYDEIAQLLNQERPELRHLPLPKTVSKHWVATRSRELRAALAASVEPL